MTSGFPDDVTMADEIAEAFRLGDPSGELEVVQKGSFETWRLTTRRSTYLVKRLWQNEDAALRAELEAAMSYEGCVSGAGIRIAPAMSPIRPLFRWAAHVGRHGVFRVYEWVDHRAVSERDDLVMWVGQTLAVLHSLEPLGPGFEPEWRWIGVRARGDWERWQASDRPWTALARERLPFLLELTDRIVRHHQDAPDHVMSHRDFGPWNVLIATGGPLLIDWEGAGPIKASAELGRVVSAFGDWSVPAMRRLIAAYSAAGGSVQCSPGDIFLWEAAHRLSNITERIAIALGEEPSEPEPVWMNLATVDDDIAAGLATLPAEIDRLTHLGVETYAAGRDQ